MLTVQPLLDCRFHETEAVCHSSRDSSALWAREGLHWDHRPHHHGHFGVEERVRWGGISTCPSPQNKQRNWTERFRLNSVTPGTESRVWRCSCEQGEHGRGFEPAITACRTGVNALCMCVYIVVLCRVQVIGMDDLLIEKLSDNSFDPLTLTQQELTGGIRRLTVANLATPILCGSSLRNMAVQPLMDAIVTYLPGPHEKPVQVCVDTLSTTLLTNVVKQVKRSEGFVCICL